MIVLHAAPCHGITPKITRSTFSDPKTPDYPMTRETLGMPGYPNTAKVRSGSSNRDRTYARIILPSGIRSVELITTTLTPINSHPKITDAAADEGVPSIQVTVEDRSVVDLVHPRDAEVGEAHVRGLSVRRITQHKYEHEVDCLVMVYSRYSASILSREAIAHARDMASRISVIIHDNI